MNKGIFFCNLRAVTDGFTHDYDSVFPMLKEHNIDGFQLGWDEICSDYSEALLAGMKRHGMKTYVIHIAVRLFADDKDIVADAMAQVRSTYPVLEKFGCRALMVIPTLRDGDIASDEDKPRAVAQAIKYLNILADEAENYDHDVFFENIGSLKLPYVSTEEVKFIVDRCPKIKFGFDTGNFIRKNSDIHEAYAALGNRIKMLHIKNRAEDLTDAPFDGGIIRLPELLCKIKADGVDAFSIMEYGYKHSYEEIFYDSAVIDKLLG